MKVVLSFNMIMEMVGYYLICVSGKNVFSHKVIREIVKRPIQSKDDIV